MYYYVIMVFIFSKLKIFIELVYLFQQLYNTCKAIQERLVELISQLANNEVTADLLRINDLLNNLFLRYA